jgi:hypothetical protein
MMRSGFQALTSGIRSSTIFGASPSTKPWTCWIPAWSEPGLDRLPLGRVSKISLMSNLFHREMEKPRAGQPDRTGLRSRRQPRARVPSGRAPGAPWRENGQTGGVRSVEISWSAKPDLWTRMTRIERIKTDRAVFDQQADQRQTVCLLSTGSIAQLLD